jgi:hypothetical protein
MLCSPKHPPCRTRYLISFFRIDRVQKEAHLMQSISIRCCSAILFSLLTFLCKAAKMVLFSANAFPQLLFKFINSSLGIPVLISVLARSPGLVIEKYSNSSLRTIIACLVTSGLADWSPLLSFASGRDCCAWNRPGVFGVP